MSSPASHMSLAYLIEISFILNLAYHELRSFKLRNDINKRIIHIRTIFPDDPLFEDIVQYRALTEFAKGEGDGWKAFKRENAGPRLYKRFGTFILRHFYRMIFKCTDRKIVVGLMISNFLLLSIITYKVLHPNSVILIPISLDISYWFVTISCVIPAVFMLLTKICRKFAFGYVDEDLNHDSGGRLGFLEKEWNKKAQSIIDRSLSEF